MGPSTDIVNLALETISSERITMDLEGPGSPEGAAELQEPAAKRPLRAFVLIPDLEIGGAEMDLARTLRIARVLPDGRFDMLHTTLPGAFIVGALASLGLKPPSLLMSRASLAFYQRGSLSSVP